MEQINGRYINNIILTFMLVFLMHSVGLSQQENELPPYYKEIPLEQFCEIANKYLASCMKGEKLSSDNIKIVAAINNTMEIYTEYVFNESCMNIELLESYDNLIVHWFLMRYQNVSNRFGFIEYNDGNCTEIPFYVLKLKKKESGVPPQKPDNQ